MYDNFTYKFISRHLGGYASPEDPAPGSPQAAMTGTELSDEQCILAAINCYQRRKKAGELEVGNKSTMLFVKSKYQDELNRCVVSAIMTNPADIKSAFTKNYIRKAVTISFDARSNTYQIEVVSRPDGFRFSVSDTRADQCNHFDGLITVNSTTRNSTRAASTRITF